MSPLPSQIGCLSVAEKLELLDALWVNIEANSTGISEEQSAELDWRMAEYERDPAAVIPWEQVKADLFKQ